MPHGRTPQCRKRQRCAPGSSCGDGHVASKPPYPRRCRVAVAVSTVQTLFEQGSTLQSLLLPTSKPSSSVSSWFSVWSRSSLSPSPRFPPAGQQGVLNINY